MEVQSTQPQPLTANGSPPGAASIVNLPPPVPGYVAQPPPPRHEPHSKLGWFVLSVAVFALGVVVLIDVAGVSVPASVYFAVPLAVVGGGLLLGGWYGRARGLIGLGVVLSIGLGIAAPVEGVTNGRSESVTWRPTSVEQVASRYESNVGDAVLDLSALDFTDQNRSVSVHLAVGNLDIILPPNVDARVEANVDVGDAVVLGQRWNGIGHSRRSVFDDGPDGPGGGLLTLTATVDVGDLEVRR